MQTLADIHDRNPVILPRNMSAHWIDSTIVGDQALVHEAVRDGVAQASQLAFYEVAPLREDGPHLINPVSDGHAVSEVRYGNDART